jgi:hypothetical protein
MLTISLSRQPSNRYCRSWRNIMRRSASHALLCHCGSCSLTLSWLYLADTTKSSLLTTSTAYSTLFPIRWAVSTSGRMTERAWVSLSSFFPPSFVLSTTSSTYDGVLTWNPNLLLVSRSLPSKYQCRGLHLLPARHRPGSFAFVRSSLLRRSYLCYRSIPDAYVLSILLR